MLRPRKATIRVLARRRRLMEVLSQPDCRPSMRELAKMFGVSLGTIKYDIDALVWLGYLAKLENGRSRQWKVKVKFGTYLPHHQADD